LKFALTLCLILCAPFARAEEPTLAIPLDCTLGETCFIQSYMDHDPGPDARDFTCGPQSYDGHKGTDFALLSLKAMNSGVDVRPALTGRVKAVRDGMADIRYDGSSDLAGRDCGNGVLINHGDGLQTQYCHMKLGSIQVVADQQVTEGTVLGQVGLSGRTQFPHLHITVRKDGRTIDPFHPDGQTDCSGDTPDTRWRDALNYVPGGLIATGFAASVPSYDDIKAGDAAATAITPTDDALVLWAYVFGGRVGDVIAFEFNGPRGLAFSNSATLEKTQAQLFRASGKRRKISAWPVGSVNGTVRLIRDGVEIDQQQATVQIRR